MIFPKNIFWEVGGFDQNIFLYYEELDICYRLKEKGYKSVVYPNCRFSHLHGESTKKAHCAQIHRQQSTPVQQGFRRAATAS